MPAMSHASRVLALAAVASLAPFPALAAQRTFVSTAGVDNASCSLAMPCRAFAAAIAATDPAGEVIVLDSGGYGSVTIAQSVSIIAPPGVYAGISVFSGNGIRIATASATDKVVLRGLFVNNQGSTGHGILFDGTGTLQLVDVNIAGFASPGSAGLRFVPSANANVLMVERLQLTGNTVGAWIAPAAAASTRATLERVVATQNSLAGLIPQNQTSITIRDSQISHNLTGVATNTVAATTLSISIDSSELANNSGRAVSPGDDAGTEFLSLTNSVVSNNGVGVKTGAGATVHLAGNRITRNGTGLLYLGTGTITSQGNNFIHDNAIAGADPTVVGSK
jgi:hypothetical protein